jgi:hypothetical protein
MNFNVKVVVQKRYQGVCTQVTQKTVHPPPPPPTHIASCDRERERDAETRLSRSSLTISEMYVGAS